MMKIGLIVAYVLLLVCEVQGYYDDNGFTYQMKNIHKVYSKCVLTPDSTTIKVARTLSSNSTYIMQKVLIFGGKSSGSPAVAEVLSFAARYCTMLKKTMTYKMFYDEFEFQFIPNIDQVNLPLYIDSNPFAIIVGIVDGKSEICGYTSSGTLGDDQKYVYNNLSLKKFNPCSITDSYLPDLQMANNTYYIEFPSENNPPANLSNPSSNYIDSFNTIFKGLTQALADPVILFDKAIESNFPTDQDPSNITIYINITNNFPFDITAGFQINLTVNYLDVDREIEYIQTDLQQYYLFNDTSTPNNIPGLYPQEANTSYQLYIPNYQVQFYMMPLRRLSKNVVEIQYTRTIGGEILFDSDIGIAANSSGYSSAYFYPVKGYSRGDLVTVLPPTSSIPTAPREVVLFLMVLVFFLVILVIVCSVLVKFKSNKLLR